MTIDHDAIAARVLQDVKRGPVGPFIAQGADAHRIDGLPDLEAAYLDLYDEVKRLRAELADGSFYKEVDIDRLQERAEKAEDERDAAISTLNAWFDRRKLGHDAVDQAVLDCTKGYLRTSRVGGMPQEDSDTVLAVIEDMAHLSVFADLFIRLDQERLEKAEAERDALRHQIPSFPDHMAKIVTAKSEALPERLATLVAALEKIPENMKQYQWVADKKHCFGEKYIRAVCGDNGRGMGRQAIASVEAHLEVADYIAAANPDTIALLIAERDALRAALAEIADGLKGIARDIQIGPDDEGREIYDMVQAMQWDARQALKGQTDD